jgi:hypothetical protein
MGDGRTFLSPVVATGGIWRVRMTWPNGTVRYFGKFTSEKEAIEWISAHPRLTKFPTENTISEPPRPSPPDVAMNRGSRTWKEVSIDFEGRTLNGYYGKYRGMLMVKWAHATKTTKLGRSPPRVLARTMLRELAAKEKDKAR